MPMTENQNRIQQILLGLGEIYTPDVLIPRLRYFLEKLSDDENLNGQLVWDLFEVLKVTSDYPVLNDLSLLLEAEDPKEILIGFFKLMEHLSYNPLGKNLKILIKFFELPEENKEHCYNSIILLLEEQSKEPNFEYCHYLKEVLLEEDVIVKIKKILDFFIFLYDCPKATQLKKAIDHYIKLDTDLQVWKFLLECLPYPILEAIKILRAQRPEAALHVAFSKSQIMSKQWAVYELNKLEFKDATRTMLILCGWYGVLPALLFKKFGDDAFDRMRSVDIDESCEPVSDKLNQPQLNQGWKYRAVTADIYELDYNQTQLPMRQKGRETFIEETNYTFIINTSCEHLDRFSNWYNSIPYGKLILLQSNDFFDCDGHVNCMKNLEEFKRSAPMSECIYQGELKLEKYTRFMLIGRK